MLNFYRNASLFKGSGALLKKIKEMQLASDKESEKKEGILKLTFLSVLNLNKLFNSFLLNRYLYFKRDELDRGSCQN